MPLRRRRLFPLLLRSFQLALLGLAVALAVHLFEGLQWGPLLHRLQAARPGMLWLAVLCLLGRFIVWDLRWRWAFARIAEVPGPLHSFFALLGAVFVNLVTPSARVFGGLLRARYVTRPGERSFGRVYGVVLFDQLAHQVILITTSWLAAIGVAALLGYTGWAVAGALALVGVSAGVTLWAKRQGAQEARAGESRDEGAPGRWSRYLATRMASSGRRWARMVGQGREAWGILRRLLADAPLRRAAMLFGVLFILVNAAAQWLVFLALDIHVDPLAVLLAVTLGTAVGSLSGTPGGLGTSEAGMVFTYVVLELARADAVAGTLLYRGLYYLVILGLGLPSFLAFELAQWRNGKAS